MANPTNFNDPLFIHPSDTPGMNLINDHLTGAEHYGVWSRAMLIALRAKNKLAFTDGTCKRANVGHIMLHQWERCNALVLSWIMNTVSKEIYGGIVYSTDASMVWADLKEQFYKVNGSRIFSIHHEIGRLSQGNGMISAYYCKIKQPWDEYASLVTLPSCECATARRYVEHDQQLKLLQFLIGLNESYMHLRSQILMMTPLPTVGQVFSIISQEESHRSISSVETTASVFYSTQNRAEESKKELLRCEYCNWNGHTKATCYKLVGYPVGHKLYKQQNIGGNKKFSKDYARNRRGAADVNLVEESNNDAQPVENASSPQVFSPAQYAEILKLFGAANLQSSHDPVANVAGPQEWEASWD